MNIHKEVQHGEMVYWTYGFAWKNWDRNTITVILIPFNWLVRWTRSLWFILRGKASQYEFEIYNRGYESGREAGERTAEIIAENKLLRALKELRDNIPPNK